ncbi:MAG: hypothetical protein OJF49_003593 [Ktedonobacterales bacterium]|nr:MAG: hypothetical protein OJF49_003593 [Ktedonobacterales bacterium]
MFLDSEACPSTAQSPSKRLAAVTTVHIGPRTSLHPGELTASAETRLPCHAENLSCRASSCRARDAPTDVAQSAGRPRTSAQWP